MGEKDLKGVVCLGVRVCMCCVWNFMASQYTIRKCVDKLMCGTVRSLSSFFRNVLYGRYCVMEIDDTAHFDQLKNQNTVVIFCAKGQINQYENISTVLHFMLQHDQQPRLFGRVSARICSYQISNKINVTNQPFVFYQTKLHSENERVTTIGLQAYLRS